MTKAAIYCRVNTDDQEKEGTSLQTQRDACLAYCKQEG
jgi:site-specific DNA recombinase